MVILPPVGCLVNIVPLHFDPDYISHFFYFQKNKNKKDRVTVADKNDQPHPGHLKQVNIVTEKVLYCN